MPVISPENRGIQVSVHDTYQQQKRGEPFAGVMKVYPLRGSVSLSGKPPREVVLLFPAPEYEPPAHVHDRLAGQTVRVLRLVKLKKADQLLAIPNSAALGGFASTSENPIIQVPEPMEKQTVEAVATGTNQWFTDRMSRYNMRMVLNDWDLFQVLDTETNLSEVLNRRAVQTVSSIIDRAAGRTIDDVLAYNLKEGVLIPGEAYVQQLLRLRREDEDSYKSLIAKKPAQRHQYLQHILASEGVKPTESLERVLLGDSIPYNLDYPPSPHDSTAQVVAKHERLSDFLEREAQRFMAETPEDNILHRLRITTQLAAAHAEWFRGKTAENSGILAAVDLLKGRAPLLTRFLRAIEVTDEGQDYSEFLRPKYIDDPEEVVVKQAA